MGYIAVHINCNDIVSSGAEPIGILLSHTAPNIPPSVTSCKAVAPICFAMIDSFITDKKPLIDFAFSI